MSEGLLLDPGGFEGLGFGAKESITDDLVATDREHLPVTHLHVDTAALPGGVVAH